jgi:hypothetical protein
MAAEGVEGVGKRGWSRWRLQVRGTVRGGSKTHLGFLVGPTTVSAAELDGPGSVYM